MPLFVSLVVAAERPQGVSQIEDDLLTLIEDSNPVYAETARRLYRLQRIEARLATLYQHYKAIKYPDLKEKQFLRELRDLIEGKP